MLRVAIGLLAFMTGLAADRAEARFRVCNKSNVRLSVAFGYVDRTRGWTAQGWWVIDVNQCSSVHEADLDNRYYYVFAQPTAGGPPWKGGKVPFCIDDKRFLLYQEQYGKNTPEECGRAGLKSALFISDDVGQGQTNHTFNFEGNLPIPGGAPPQQPQPPVATAQPPPQPLPPPVATGPHPPAPPPAPNNANGTACQRYPNLC